MDSSQGSTMTSAAAAANVDVSVVDLLPVYVKELIAGGAAGAFSKTAVAPLERIKILLQVCYLVPFVNNPARLSSGLRMFSPQPAYTGIGDVFKKVYMEGGTRPTLIGILPYAGLKFYIYEDLKARVPEEYQKSVVLRLSCGALAGLFGQTLTYPLDVGNSARAFIHPPDSGMEATICWSEPQLCQDSKGATPLLTADKISDRKSIADMGWLMETNDGQSDGPK
ncbi:hypothetical protein BHE74_00036375 [Ensete ventricosum]|nr:hypothetical protein BHE74_00036375 [Ensete ventricosum]